MPNKIIKFLGAGFPGMLAEKIEPYLKKWLDKKAGHTPAEGDAEKTDANPAVPSVNAANTVDRKLAEQLRNAEGEYAKGKKSGVDSKSSSEKSFTPLSDAKAGAGTAEKPTDVPAKAKPEPDKPAAASPKSPR